MARRLPRSHRSTFAQRAGVSGSTMEAIERGELSTGIGAYVRALWALGLDGELNLLADPDLGVWAVDGLQRAMGAA